MALLIKPMRKWLSQGNRLRRIRLSFRVRCDGNIVNRNVFLGLGRNLNLISILVCANIDGAGFNGPDPESESSVYKGVESNSSCGVVFCRVESEFVVPAKGCCTYYESGVAKY